MAAIRLLAEGLAISNGAAAPPDRESESRPDRGSPRKTQPLERERAQGSRSEIAPPQKTMPGRDTHLATQQDYQGGVARPATNG